MNKIVEDIKERLVKDLKKIFGEKLDKVIIYGSYARGEEDKESDIDVMVLVNEPEDELRTYEKTIDELSVNYDLEYMIVLSIMIKGTSFFDQYEEVLPFIKNVVNEGIEIYGG